MAPLQLLHKGSRIISLTGTQRDPPFSVAAMPIDQIKGCIALGYAAGLADLAIFDDLTSDPDHQYLMLDSTVVRAHKAANGKNGPKIRLWGAPEED